MARTPGLGRAGGGGRVRIPCPVCYRDVHASERGRVECHADTANRPCPMGGVHLNPRKDTSHV